MSDVTLQDPTRRQLYGKVVEMVHEVDHRKLVHRLGNTYDVAKDVCDRVHSAPQGLFNLGGYAGNFNQMTSVMGVAWITRRYKLVVRIKTERRQGPGEVFRGDKNLPILTVLEEKIQAVQDRRFKVLEKFVTNFVGADCKHIDDIFPTHLIDRTWATTSKGMVVSYRDEFYFCIPGYAVRLPQWLTPNASLWGKLQSSEDRIKRIKKWAMEAGKIPEDPMTDIIDLLDSLECDGGKATVIKAIKHLMEKHEVSVEDLE